MNGNQYIKHGEMNCFNVKKLNCSWCSIRRPQLSKGAVRQKLGKGTFNSKVHWTNISKMSFQTQFFKNMDLNLSLNVEISSSKQIMSIIISISK